MSSAWYYLTVYFKTPEEAEAALPKAREFLKKMAAYSNGQLNLDPEDTKATMALMGIYEGKWGGAEAGFPPPSYYFDVPNPDLDDCLKVQDDKIRFSGEACGSAKWDLIGQGLVKVTEAEGFEQCCADYVDMFYHLDLVHSEPQLDLIPLYEELREFIEEEMRDRGDLDWSPEYKEPGYSDPPKGKRIYFSDWNDDSHWIESEKKFSHSPNLRFLMGNLLGKMGHELEWSDEWATCTGCCGAVRTKADSYGWQPSYVMGDGELLCLECFNSNKGAQECLIEEMMNNPDRAINMEDPPDLSKWHWVKLNQRFENGWHPGQADNPHKILALLEDEFDVVFVIDEVGQFDINFDCWIRAKDFEQEDWKDYLEEEWLNKASDLLLDRRQIQDYPGPAEKMAAALRGAAKTVTIQGSANPTDHPIKFSQVDISGPEPVVRTALISPQDFVEGKSLEIMEKGKRKEV